MIVSALSDVGSIREINEDSIFASGNIALPLFVVADGMGGHNAGDIASSMAVDIVKEEFITNSEKLNSPAKIRKTIKDALVKANTFIYKKSVLELSCEGMGTTLVLGYYFNSKFYIGHVGDSRAYIITDNNIRQITDDHTLVNELVKKGNITKSQAQNHPQRNMITRALGSAIDIEIDTYEVDFSNQDIFLLCSDGLYNMVNDSEIMEIINNSISLEDGVKYLVNMANENGGIDNITVIAIKLDNEVLE